MTRVLAIADSDSYLKWAAWLLDGAPPDWTASLVVVSSPTSPTPEQVAAALHGTRYAEVADRPWTLPRIVATVRRQRPDVVLLACTGPVVEVVADAVIALSTPRPVLVAGLPGISVPATERAVRHRRAVDVLVVHSHRERRDFADLAARGWPRPMVGLARLPFVRDEPTAPMPTAPMPTAPMPTAPMPTASHGLGRARQQRAGAAPRRTVVFAPQAKVPPRKVDRVRILIGLDALAAQRTDLDVVVKVRAWASEPQTHRERYPYDLLWDELVTAGVVRPDALGFASGSMAEALEQAAAFVTVSSTAALESIARQVPTLVLGDFGVNARMINVVFEGSGLIGTLDDLAAGSFSAPDPRWCRANYFHSPQDEDWLALVARAALRPRPERAPGRRLRPWDYQVVRLSVPLSWIQATRGVRWGLWTRTSPLRRRTRVLG